MTRRRWLLVILLTVSCGALVLVLDWRAKSGAPTLVETAGHEARFWQDQLGRHVEEVSPTGTQVHLLSDGTFHAYSARDGELLLSVGDTFNGPPDHHARCTFTVQAITNQGVTMAYRSEFDHRSFGRNQISVDRGRVLLAWRIASATPRSSTTTSSSPP